MSTELNETLSAEGLLDAIDFAFLPWGNTYYPQDDCPGQTVYNRTDGVPCWQEKCGTAGEQPAACFSGAPLCQHGSDECAADRYEACAFAVAPTASASAFAYCLEAEGVDVSLAEECAASAGVEWSALSACSAGEQGDEVAVTVANATALFTWSTGATWQGTPTVVLAGVPLSTTENLLAQVCAQIEVSGASKPAGCASTT